MSVTHEVILITLDTLRGCSRLVHFWGRSALGYVVERPKFLYIQCLDRIYSKSKAHWSTFRLFGKDRYAIRAPHSESDLITSDMTQFFVERLGIGVGLTSDTLAVGVALPL